MLRFKVWLDTPAEAQLAAKWMQELREMREAARPRVTQVGVNGIRIIDENSRVPPGLWDRVLKTQGLANEAAAILEDGVQEKPKRRRPKGSAPAIDAPVQDSTDAAQQSLLEHHGIPSGEPVAEPTPEPTPEAPVTPSVTLEEAQAAVTQFVMQHGQHGVAKAGALLKEHFGGRRVRELAPEELPLLLEILRTAA